jgi:hypothetical protein
MEKRNEGFGENFVQIDLDGSKTNNIPPVNLPVKDILRFCYRLDDSLWETLRFFYNAHYEGYSGLTKAAIWEVHFKFGHRLCINSVENNLKRLEKDFLIKCIRKDMGRTRRGRLYQITEKGKLLWEEYELYANRKKTFL